MSDNARLLRCIVPVLVVAACTPTAPHVEEIASPATAQTEAQDPALAIDPATGDLLLTWIGGQPGAWQIYFARSRDQGGSWGTPALVTPDPNEVEPHAEAAPRLVAAPGALAVVWSTSYPVSGRQWPASNIRASRSVDGGVTWSLPITLNDDTTSGPGGHTFHGAAWVGDSAIAVTWLDERHEMTTAHHDGNAPLASPAGHEGHGAAPMAEDDATIYMAWSSDLGHTWAANTAMWPAACPCCRISLARGPDGRVMAAWRQHFAGDVRDVVAAPLDRAAPSPARVHEDGWVFPGCPHTGPGVAVGGNGTVHVAWYTGKPDAPGIYYGRNLSNGETFSAAIPIATRAVFPSAHTAVAAVGGGAVVAYDIGAEGTPSLVIAEVRSDGSAGGSAEIAGTDGADHPQLVSLNETQAIVAWTSVESAGARVRLARIDRGNNK